MLTRRGWIAAAGVLPLIGGCDSPSVQTFPDLAAARRAVQGLTAGWGSTGALSLAQVLEHAAQSVEFSMQGFPAPKSALFQATAGRAAFAVFDARGQMSHGLDEPIPGAPALKMDLPQAQARLLRALDAFEAHTGPLAPHFAYGALDKNDYTRAHLMHLANHWTELVRA